jgi:hypothetical protein
VMARTRKTAFQAAGKCVETTYCEVLSTLKS